jgi:hypothetical protein
VQAYFDQAGFDRPLTLGGAVSTARWKQGSSGSGRGYLAAAMLALALGGCGSAEQSSLAQVSQTPSYGATPNVAMATPTPANTATLVATQSVRVPFTSCGSRL